MNFRDNVRVCLPRYLHVGSGSLNGLPQLLASVGDDLHPLIVTDKVMVEIGIIAQVQALLKAHGMTSVVYDAILPDPTDSAVLAGIAMLEAQGCNCVIAVGGGSPLDAGKAIAVMSLGSRDILDYRPPLEYSGPALPMIAIPTTAGTGSEVTHHTVLVHDETREKISCRGESFVPLAAVIDHELTLTKPKRLIADNALDTLTHAIEAYVSRKRTLFSDRMALDAMRLIGQFLTRAHTDPDDLEAREGLMLAATLAGIAFSNASIGLVHAMSRPMGASFHIPHGMSNAMLLQAVTEFSAPAAPGRYADCARAIGFAAEGDSDGQAVENLMAGLATYTRSFAIPSLADLGIVAQEFETALGRMAEEAIASGAPNNNPRIASKEEIIAIFKSMAKNRINDFCEAV